MIQNWEISLRVNIVSCYQIDYTSYIIEAKWRIYGLTNYTIIGSNALIL